MIPNLYELAADDSAVTSILGGDDGDIKLYRDEIPEADGAGHKIKPPYARFSVITGQPYNKLDEAPDMDDARVQFDAFGKTSDDADAAYRALRDCFEPHGYVVNYGTDRDPETRYYRVMFEMTFKTSR